MIPTAFELYIRVGVEFFFSEQLLVLNSASAKQDLLIINNYFDYKKFWWRVEFFNFFAKKYWLFKNFQPSPPPLVVIRHPPSTRANINIRMALVVLGRPEKRPHRSVCECAQRLSLSPHARLSQVARSCLPREGSSRLLLAEQRGGSRKIKHPSTSYFSNSEAASVRPPRHT